MCASLQCSIEDALWNTLILHRGDLTSQAELTPHQECGEIGHISFLKNLIDRNGVMHLTFSSF